MFRTYTMREMAEDAGHMGYSATDYPGCPERLAKARKKKLEAIKQIELQFDEASRDIITER